MTIQITNKNNERLFFMQLNREAAEYFHVDNTSAPVAPPNRCYSWYDFLDNIKASCSGWWDVFGRGLGDHIGNHLFNMHWDMSLDLLVYMDEDGKYLNQDASSKIASLLMAYKPYIDLFNYWQAKGYTIKIKEV